MAKTVLIVDDIYLNRRVLLKSLQATGYHVLEAENGKEAIEMLKVHDICCVLMDIEMPVMNGIETVRYIRTQMLPPKSEVKIFAITAYDNDTIHDYLDFSGFDGVISKPFSMQQIEKILSQA
ncbi:MAG: response regulator [Bacteroidales bacterium]